MWETPFFSKCVKSARSMPCDGACSGCSGLANIAGNWTTVMIGFPVLTAEELDCPAPKLRTDTRFLPKVLVELGLFKSNSEALRQCPEWKKAWADDESAFAMIRLAKNGKRKGEFVAILVGPKENHEEAA